jgi:NitT/TauT family transport system substrate-binding protein
MKRWGAICALGALLAVVGCGGDEDDARPGQPSNQRETTRLSVQVLPISDVVPIYLGQKKGFFRKQGIELDIKTAQGGAEIVPLVLNGSVQIGYSNLPSLFIASVKGLPLQIVAPAGGGIPKELANKEGTDQVDAIMVRKDSPIREPEDLADATIGVNTLNNISDVTTRGALEKHGVDSSKIKWLEVPLPDMLGALDAKRVDAVFIVSPFKTIGEKSGKYRSVMFPQIDTRPGMVTTAYFASRQWAEENQDVLDRFLAALRESMVYAEGHDAEMRQTLSEYTELPKNIVGDIPIGAREPACAELQPSSERLAGLMVKYKALEKMPDFGQLIRPDFCEQG